MSGGLKISMAGSGAVLLDPAGPVLSEALQGRILAVAAALRGEAWVAEAVPGVNNLLVTFDPLGPALDQVMEGCLTAWERIPEQEMPGRQVRIPVAYGGEASDLAEMAAHLGMSEAEIVRRHTAAVYRVAALGAMPGFPYMLGLDPGLAWARRKVPRPKLFAGSVCVGGAQAGVMPVDAPSGWHVLGHTDARLFDPAAVEPCLLRPGDIVRFEVAA